MGWVLSLGQGCLKSLSYVGWACVFGADRGYEVKLVKGVVWRLWGLLTLTR